MRLLTECSDPATTLAKLSVTSQAIVRIPCKVRIGVFVCTFVHQTYSVCFFE